MQHLLIGPGKLAKTAQAQPMLKAITGHLRGKNLCVFMAPPTIVKTLAELLAVQFEALAQNKSKPVPIGLAALVDVIATQQPCLDKWAQLKQWRTLTEAQCGAGLLSLLSQLGRAPRFPLQPNTINLTEGSTRLAYAASCALYWTGARASTAWS